MGLSTMSGRDGGWWSMALICWDVLCSVGTREVDKQERPNESDDVGVYFIF